MPLPVVTGEFGVVADPEVQFSTQGKAWMKIRCVAKDRVRDSNGTWADGDPTFIDVVVFGKTAENLTDSIAKGDGLIIIGKLQQQEWTDKETQAKRIGYRIVADEIGVSVKWNPAKTPRYIEINGDAAGQKPAGAADDPWASDEPPF